MEDAVEQEIDLVRGLAQGRLTLELCAAFSGPLEPAVVGAVHGAFGLYGAMLRDVGERAGDRVCAYVTRYDSEDEDEPYDEEDMRELYANDALYVAALIDHAVRAHHHSTGLPQGCGCGGTRSCHRSGTSFYELLKAIASIATYSPWLDGCLQDILDDFLNALDDGEGSRQQSAAPTSVLSPLQELDRQLLAILGAGRSEFRTREIALRLPSATSAQIGGRLRSLEARGLVEILRYHDPDSGYDVNTWRAV